ncbi:MAG: hypothetical protein K2Y22_04350 [Candidatus Obscuribacterales bacterium]|nr:hypothetical protein [Candidatus Obscuribacterales bacterium]
MVCEYPESNQVIQCNKCAGYHGSDIECIEVVRANAHRLLREKSDDFHRFMNRIMNLEKTLKFYADPKTYRYLSKDETGKAYKPIGKDLGAKAREVLGK